MLFYLHYCIVIHSFKCFHSASLTRLRLTVDFNQNQLFKSCIWYNHQLFLKGELLSQSKYISYLFDWPHQFKKEGLCCSIMASVKIFQNVDS